MAGQHDRRALRQGGHLVSAEERGRIEAALQTLGESDAGAIGVTDADGRLVGLLTRENVAEMMMIKAAQPEWKFQARR